MKFHYLLSHIVLLFLCIALGANTAHAQAADVSATNAEEIKKLKAELEALKNAQQVRLQELERLISDLRSKLEATEQEDELQKLLDEATNLAAQDKEQDEGVGKRFQSGTRQLQILNPNVSLLGEFYSGVSSESTDEINEALNGNNNLFIRGLELNIDAAIDPFTRGVTTIAFTEEEIELELGYLEWLNLPLQANVRAGKIRPEFGQFNRHHLHALPQFDKPRVLVNYLGPENMAGFGIASNFLLPKLFADANSFEFSVLRGGNGASFTEDGSTRLLYVGSLKSFYDINESTYFELGLSGATGNNDEEENYNTYLGDISFTLKWAPPSRSKYRWVDWKTEFLFSKREDPAGDINTFGFYTSLQNKVSARFVVGGRVGYSEIPFDESQSELDYTVNVDFWQSEFVLARLQYQYNDRDLRDDLFLPNEGSLFFHVIWAMGPHKHTDY